MIDTHERQTVAGCERGWGVGGDKTRVGVWMGADLQWQDLS